MNIRKIKRDDVKKVASLINKTFKRFCSDEATKDGLTFYLGHHSSKKSEEDLWKMYNSEIAYVAVKSEK
ncbi:MAG TPA: hypothetical protein ENH20_01005, partial [Candidatus Pacearchaeota archaeon]|nr:hypothetical protein [Candidatus Pacearchaeota archaeon]